MKNLLTRSFYCPDHSNHVFAKYYIAFAGTRQFLFPYVIEMRILQDITPHIISFNEEVDGKYPIIVSCGIVGCGVELNNIHDITEGMTIIKANHFLLDKKDFEAMINFKNTGYELSKSKRK